MREELTTIYKILCDIPVKGEDVYRMSAVFNGINQMLMKIDKQEQEKEKED